MENLEEILFKLHSASEELGKDIYIDDEVYQKEGFYIVISESGKIGAFGTVVDDVNDSCEKNIFLVLDENKIKYLHDEGFNLQDFYKVMGEKLFRKLNLEDFIIEMTS
jgi:hypothetical protein